MPLPQVHAQSAEVAHTTRLLGWPLWLSTAAIYLGGAAILGSLLLPTTNFLFGKMPWVVALSIAAPVLILIGWTVLSQGYSLRTMLLGVVGAMLLMGLANYRVRYQTSEAFSEGPLFRYFRPSAIEWARFVDDLRSHRLAELFDPVFADEGYEPGFGLYELKIKSYSDAINDFGRVETRLSWKWYAARHPQPERPIEVVKAYAFLKGDCLAVEHCDEAFRDRYYQARTSIIPDTLTGPTGTQYPMTHEGALKIFRRRVNAEWGDARPFLRAIAERDPDPLLREAAESLLKAEPQGGVK